MRLSDFDYPLPAELIAQTPADRRDASRLLVVRGGGQARMIHGTTEPDGRGASSRRSDEGAGRPPVTEERRPDAPQIGRQATESRELSGLEHRRFEELPSLLPDNALLVVNDARVIPARLHARKPSGGQVEIFLVEPRAGGVWACLVRAKSLADGTELELVAPRGAVTTTPAPRVTFLGRVDGEPRVHIDGPAEAWADWGEVPLPPYIERAPTEVDRDRYQTIFAQVPGAVAAPTAGLHFTPATLAALDARGIERASVTLHVGPGTFAPVRVDEIEHHVMHVERAHVPEATARAYDAARAAGRPIVAVGTTVVRTLESALREDGTLAPGPLETRLFIHPPRKVRCADLLLTNFHMPRSTLLMLVAAFAGRDRILAAYAQAAARGYRFFSYGDATLLEREAA